MLKAISLLRIKDWLYKIWQPQLTSKLLTYHSRKVTNYNLIFQLSQLAKNNITLANINSLLSLSSSLPSLQSNIYNILPSNINLATTNSLRNNKLLFVEQITTADNLHLLPWNNIYLWTNKSTKEKLPKWFSQLIVKLNNKTISEK